MARAQDWRCCAIDHQATPEAHELEVTPEVKCAAQYAALQLFAGWISRYFLGTWCSVQTASSMCFPTRRYRALSARWGPLRRRCAQHKVVSKAHVSICISRLPIPRCATNWSRRPTKRKSQVLSRAICIILVATLLSSLFSLACSPKSGQETARAGRHHADGGAG